MQHENVLTAQHSDSVSVRGIYFAESNSSWIQACMKRMVVSNVEHAEETQRPGGQGAMLNSIASFFRSLFGRKDDNYKALLIADLGIER